MPSKLTTANLAQIFSPIALAIAYFSMPQAVIPFELSFKHWLIMLLVMAAVVRLLFFVFGGGPGRLVNAVQLDGKVQDRLLSVQDRLARFLPRRNLRNSDPSQEGIELDYV